jgi:phage/plasmid-like protein (TIGR03299 family)
MAHAITQRDTGIYEFCFSGSRSAIWHGLGQELSEDSPIDVWKVEAGMNWQVRQAPMMFMNADNEPTAVEARKILYRSDNAFQLGIVGEDYKIVQPGQVLEFFDDLTRLHGMKLSTAGTLFGGKHFWALAKTGQKTDVLPGDEVDAYVLLTTSADGTAATQARFTSTRVVCNNTLNIALAEKAKKMVKVTHHREWDATQVKIDLGLLGKSWADFTANMERLTKIAMDEKATRAFYQKIFFNPDKLADISEPMPPNAFSINLSTMRRSASAWSSASLSGLKKIFW